MMLQSPQVFLDEPRNNGYVRDCGFHETYVERPWYPESETVCSVDEETGNAIVKGTQQKIGADGPQNVYRPDGTYVDDPVEAREIVANATHVWYTYYAHVSGHWLTRWNNGGLFLFTDDARKCRDFVRDDDGTLFGDDGCFPQHTPATLAPFPVDSIAGDYLYNKFHHLPYREVADQSGELIGYELRPGEEGDGRVSDFRDELTYMGVFYPGDAHYQLHKHTSASEPGDTVKPEEEIAEAA